jgi:DNA (cytosine-5)-methyltransferase 1
MNELSLFSGAGGGLLGTKLLGWRAVGYVEYNPYCQAVLQARIKDGILDPAPIFGDIREFVSSGAAECYRGVVDVVTAGFPCQPFSVAGRKRGADDPRNMWPATRDCIRVVRPRFCLLENVRGLLANRYFGTILRELADMGLDARWGVFSASEVGARHKRERLFILAYPKIGESGRVQFAGLSPDVGASRELSNARHNESHGRDEAQSRRERAPRSESTSRSRIKYWDTDPADYPETSESYVGRVVDGVAHRVDRLSATGNGQVPGVVAAAWERLTHE